MDKHKKGEGKMMPSKEDRAEFQKMLYEWSIGRYSDKFYAFYAHLSEHGKKDGLPFLEKDLLFCIDSIRLRVNISLLFTFKLGFDMIFNKNN